MTRSHRILITGATGSVGPIVVKAFHDAGYSIRTLSIDTPPVGVWPDVGETLIGDVTDVADVSAAMEGVEAVVHLAALLHIVNPSPALEGMYERVNVGGVALVVDAAIRAGVRRVVLFSTIAVYGRSDRGILTEDSPLRPETFYARTKCNAEEIVLKAKGENGRSLGSVLRLGAVYGSRIKGNYERLVQSLASGRFLPVGNGSNRRTLIYDKDVARAAVLAATHDYAAGHVYNISDGGMHTLKEIIEAICNALGRKPPGFSLPVAPVRFAAGILEDWTRLFGRNSSVNRSTIDKYTEDIAVNTERIQKELGFVPKYGLKKGWRETIQEMREAGVL